ncbi:MAG: hypothetical protein J2O44_00515 [Porphyrobacter sp.]|nr:hypothetical protein [Porphyrobacter sp.]
MRNIILTSAAALALAAVPAIAQDNTPQTDANSDAPASAPSNAQPADQAPPAPQSADQANAEAPPAPPTTTVQTDAATGASAAVTTFPGNDTGPPASALNKKYPVCTRKLQDECQNPGEGGAPGRSRALSYWPGRPASERHR